MAPSTSNQARCVLACALKDPRETLSQDQMEQYDSCVEFVSTFGLEESEAEKVVKESFGWAGRKYWRKQRVRWRHPLIPGPRAAMMPIEVPPRIAGCRAATLCYKGTNIPLHVWS